MLSKKEVSSLRLDRRHAAVLEILKKRRVMAGYDNPSRSELIRSAIEELAEKEGISEEDIQREMRILAAQQG